LQGIGTAGRSEKSKVVLWVAKGIRGQFLKIGNRDSKIFINFTPEKTRPASTY
jgi:hypothetical protein